MAKVLSESSVNMVAREYCDWKMACKQYDRAVTILRAIMSFSLSMTCMLMMWVVPWSEVEQWVCDNFCIRVNGPIELLIALASSTATVVLLVLIMLIERMLFRWLWLDKLRNKCDLAQYAYLYSSALTGLSVKEAE